MFEITAQVNNKPISVPDAFIRKRSEAANGSVHDGLTADEEEAIVSGPWVASLPASARQALMQRSAVRHVAAGRQLLRQGTVSEQWFGIASGAVRLRTTTVAGQQVVASIIGPGEWFGDYSLLGGLAEPYDADAFSDVTLIAMHRVALHALTAMDPAFNAELLKFACNRGRGWHSAAIENVTLSLKERVAALLLRLAARFGSKHAVFVNMMLPMSQQEMADFVGCSRQRLNQCLRGLVQAKIISLNSGCFTILSLEALRSRAGGASEL